MSHGDFLKVSGTVAGGLTLGFCYLKVKLLKLLLVTPNAWISIGSDNKVTVFVARAEMGQDVYTSMTMLVAEELNMMYQK